MHASLAPALKVFIVAAPLAGWALQSLVQSAFPRCASAGTSPSVDEALEPLEDGMADLVVLATPAASLSDLAQFCRRVPARVLLVTDSSDQRWLEGALRAGVNGVVSTAAAPEVFLAALDKVAHGERWVAGQTRASAPSATRGVHQRLDMDQRRIASLTTRERAAVAAIAADPSAQGKLIARRLGISEHTLRNHLTSVYSKLDVANRVALYSYALRHGLIATLPPMAGPISRPGVASQSPRTGPPRSSSEPSARAQTAGAATRQETRARNARPLPAVDVVLTKPVPPRLEALAPLTASA